MPDLQVIEFDRNGPADTGLQPWDPLPAEILQSGNPLQSGHTYHEIDGGVFTAGVWDCTEHQLLSSAYEVDEFMIVLEGSIIIEHDDGETRRFREGESFVIPRGTPCSWKQDEYVRKFWAIHAPNTELLGDPALHAILADPHLPLAPVAGLEASDFETGIPEMGLISLYRDPTGSFEAGIWECSPMRRVPGRLARSELMHILEGNGSITNADGVVFEFGPGDTFLVPLGMGYQWCNETPVKKLFCSYTP